MKNLSHSWVKSAAGNVGVDVSYNNMYYMNMVNTVLMGEIAANRAAADMGYRMVDNWLRYVQIAGLHEFSSPTYYWVQINALYVGYMYAKRPGARALFGAILDHTWADIAANYFAPSQTISGPESRDYDFLYGHGALMVHLYAQGFPGMTNGSLVCEWKDTHCERNDAGQNAYALHNQLFADGYRPSASIRRLSVAPYREVRGTFIGQRVDANGIMRAFAERYNYVANDSYAIGSASQDYITNTHTKYFPGPQDKLLQVVLGVRNASMVRPVPAITLVPDYLDRPYGHVHEPLTDKPSHLALHPGMVQHQNVLLATTAINVQDTLDGFALNVSQPAGSSPPNDGVSWNGVTTSTILPLAARSVWIQPPDATAPIERFEFPSHPFERVVQLGSTLGLFAGKGAVGIRVFAADASPSDARPNRTSADLMLAGDAQGMPLGAVRLVATHFKGRYMPAHADSHGPYGVPDADTRLRFGALFKAAKVPSDEDGPAVVAALVHSLATAELTHNERRVGNATIWEVKATVDGEEPIDAEEEEGSTHTPVYMARRRRSRMVELSVARNLTCSSALADDKGQSIHSRWNCLVSRRVGGLEAVPGPLQINGALAPPIPSHFL